jgi:hypothetical protein
MSVANSNHYPITITGFKFTSRASTGWKTWAWVRLESPMVVNPGTYTSIRVYVGSLGYSETGYTVDARLFGYEGLTNGWGDNIDELIRFHAM